MELTSGQPSGTKSPIWNMRGRKYLKTEGNRC